MKKFNVRVYGLLLYQNCLLVTQEKISGQIITKLPGGGLEFGEGTTDCLKREFKEELNLEIEIHNHFYTTDFFVPSAFDDSQVISIYYTINSPNINPTIHVASSEKMVQSIKWVPIIDLESKLFHFPIDKHVINLFKSAYNH